MKKNIIITILLVILVSYIIAINILSSFIISFMYNEEVLNESAIFDSSITKINVGNSVDISIKRPRWYGTIYENYIKKDLSILNIINFPLKAGNVNFSWFHLAFFSGLAFIGYKLNKKKITKNENLG